MVGSRWQKTTTDRVHALQALSQALNCSSMRIAFVQKPGGQAGLCGGHFEANQKIEETLWRCDCGEGKRKKYKGGRRRETRAGKGTAEA